MVWFHISADTPPVAEKHITESPLGPTGVPLISCVALEKLRITVIYPRHLAILAEILPTRPKTITLPRIVLDANAMFSEEFDMDRAEWRSLDMIISEYVERISAKDSNRRLVLRFRAGMALCEHDRWVMDHDGLVVSFPEVGRVEFVSKH